MGVGVPQYRIIEFNGLPGTGKTTISRLLPDCLDPGIIGPVSFRYYRNRFERTPFSLFLSPKYIGRISLIRQFASLFESRCPLEFTLQPLKFIRMYEHFVKDNETGVLVIDQGFVQGVISIAHTQRFFDAGRLKELVTASGFNDLPVLVVNCSCQLQEADERLSQREDKGSRIQHMEEERKRQALLVQQQNFDTIRGIVASSCPNVYAIDLDTEKEPEINAGIIRDVLTV